MNSYTSPWKEFVPDLVIAFTTLRKPSIFGREAAGQNGELLYGVHTQGSADNVAGALWRIVDADSIQR